jgi:hypothetical protein
MLKMKITFHHYLRIIYLEYIQLKKFVIKKICKEKNYAIKKRENLNQMIFVKKLKQDFIKI